MIEYSIVVKLFVILMISINLNAISFDSKSNSSFEDSSILSNMISHRNHHLICNDQHTEIKSIENIYEIRMTDLELKLFDKYLSQSSNYMEFGCGGSTRLACSYNNLTINSVDSSLDWINKLKNTSDCIIEAVKQNRMTFSHIDIGEIGNWGSPIEKEKKHLWHNYSEALNPILKYADLVLIDGRFRIPTAIEVALNADENTTVAIHDFFIRPHYHQILKFFNIVDCAENLVLLKRRTLKDFYLKEALNSIKRSINDPA